MGVSTLALAYAGAASMLLIRKVKTSIWRLNYLDIKYFAAFYFVVLMVLYPSWLALLQYRGILLILLMPLLIHVLVAVRSSIVPQPGVNFGYTLTANLFPRKMAPLIVSEVKLMWRAIFQWGRPRLNPGERAFTSYGTFAPALLAVLVLSAVEIFILHLVLARFSVTAAKVATVLGVVGAIYILGILKSLRALPTVVGGREVKVRLGSLQKAAFPLTSLKSISRVTAGLPLGPEIAKMSGLSAPNVLIELHNPITIDAHMSNSRVVSGLAVYLDKSEEFISAITKEGAYQAN